MSQYIYSRRRPFHNDGQGYHSPAMYNMKWDKVSRPIEMHGEDYDEVRENFIFNVEFKLGDRRADICACAYKAYPHLIANRENTKFKCEERMGVTYLKSEEYKINGKQYFDIIHRNDTVVGLFLPIQVLEGRGTNPGKPPTEGNPENL